MNRTGKGVGPERPAKPIRRQCILCVVASYSALCRVSCNLQFSRPGIFIRTTASCARGGVR